jgi:hypothetical protein
MAVGRLLQVARKPRVVGESVPINELMASMHAVRSVLLLKYILEEPSGATRGFDTVETTLEGSAQPIPVGVSGAVVTAVNHAERAPRDESRILRPIC